MEDDWGIALIATMASLVSAATAAYTVYVQVKSSPKVHFILVNAYVNMEYPKAKAPVWVFRIVNIGTAPARNVHWSAPIRFANHNNPSPAGDILMPGEEIFIAAELEHHTLMESFPWDITVTWREAPRFGKVRSKGFEGSPEAAREYGGGY